VPQPNAPPRVFDGGTGNDPQQNYIKIYEAVQNKNTVFSYVTKRNVAEMNLRFARTS
jgi:hypothetical protein